MGMIAWPESGAAAFKGETWHGRRDGPDNAFAYAVDFVLLRLWPEAATLPPPFSRGRLGLLGVLDRDHGAGDGAMADWALAHARAQGLDMDGVASVWLLTQPRRFGYIFNPVSFWFFVDHDGAVAAAIAEVNNTYGDRHSYFCRPAPGGKLEDGELIVLPKRFYVSPFQEIAGDYAFRFRMTGQRIAIGIDHRRGDGGMVATLNGDFADMTAGAAFAMACRRPLGALRVSLLIHWQALKLKLKGAVFRRRPTPPIEDITA